MMMVFSIEMIFSLTIRQNGVIPILMEWVITVILMMTVTVILISMNQCVALRIQMPLTIVMSHWIQTVMAFATPLIPMMMGMVFLMI